MLEAIIITIAAIAVALYELRLAREEPHSYAARLAATLITQQAIEIDRLKGLIARGYVVCDGDDEDAVAFRNDARAALENHNDD